MSIVPVSYPTVYDRSNMVDEENYGGPVTLTLSNGQLGTIARTAFHSLLWTMLENEALTSHSDVASAIDFLKPEDDNAVATVNKSLFQVCSFVERHVPNWEVLFLDWACDWLVDYQLRLEDVDGHWVFRYDKSIDTMRGWSSKTEDIE